MIKMSSNFNSYKALPEPLINAVTSMTVCELLRVTEVSSVQRLPGEFLKRGDPWPPESKVKSKFWYKKLHGVPFRFSDDFNKVCTLFPEVQRLLLHPVWTLLSKPQCSEHEIKQLAVSLSVYVQKQIISPKTLLITETKEPFKFLMLNACDALFCLLAHYLKSPTPESARLSYNLTTGLILSLFAIPYNQSKYGRYLYSELWPFYKVFKNTFKKLTFLDTDGSKLIVADIQSPLSSNLITTDELFAAYCKIYSEIIFLAYEKLNCFKNIEEARKFVLMTPNSQLHELKFNLEHYHHHKNSEVPNQLNKSLDLFFEHYTPIRKYFTKP